MVLVQWRVHFERTPAQLAVPVEEISRNVPGALFTMVYWAFVTDAAASPARAARESP